MYKNLNSSHATFIIEKINNFVPSDYVNSNLKINSYYSVPGNIKILVLI